MKPLLLFAATALSATFAGPALAQDHSGHEQHTPAPEPAPPGQPDHSQMDHGQMDHPEAVDHDEADEAEIFHQPGIRLPPRPVEASGTSRLPAAEGMMPGLHFGLGDGWMGMAHGYAWGIYTDQGGPRGDDKLYVASMAMLMAEKDFGGARLQLKSMMSAEPLMDARGYPNLFATGETANGEPLVDRQHPHDLFM
ncbi:MAG TPA: hypothetical protein VNB28_09860, partial [Methylomirabilota bacterium]|nr:hypothetical protein [Methylomirabilota bacterium]